MRSGIRIALDLGAARIGVARTDPQATMALPVTSFNATADWHTAFSKMLDEYEPIEVIIGLPINLSGVEGEAAVAIREIANELASEFPNTVFRLFDERMTTSSARKQLQQAGHTTRSDRALIDAQAATVLLEDALESERRQGTPPGEVIS